jgi:hypothetical protein
VLLKLTTSTAPPAVAGLPEVREAKAKDATGHDLIVGTLSNLGDGFARGDPSPFDALLVDEAYQAGSAKYFAVAGLAPVHLLVRDSGRINPFAPAADPSRWRGRTEDPLRMAVGVLPRNHPQTPARGRRVPPRPRPVVCASDSAPAGVRGGRADSRPGDDVLKVRQGIAAK